MQGRHLDHECKQVIDDRVEEPAHDITVSQTLNSIAGRLGALDARI